MSLGLNVDHRKQANSNGQILDFGYLVGLGPQALPAIDRYLAGGWNEAMRTQPNVHRDLLVKQHRAELDSWRAWSFRGERLTRYLDRTSASPPYLR
jgi:hypothetical protein